MCNVATGTITMSSDRMREGVKFSMPTYVTGLGAMIYSPQGTAPTRTYFNFFRPFSWQVSTENHRYH